MSTASNDTLINQLRSGTNIIYAVMGVVLFVGGTIGNLCNIVVFMRIRTLSRLAASWFLLASFIGSQMLVSTSVLSRAIFGITGVESLATSVFWCKFRWLIGPAGGLISITCICFAAIDRYLITSRQVNRHRWITPRRAQYIIVIVVFVWFMTSLPNVFLYTFPSCSVTNAIYSQYLTFYNISTYSVFPLIILPIFSYLTWNNLRRGVMAGIGQNRLQSQVTRMMFAQFGLVFGASVPNMVLQSYLAATRNIAKTPLRVAQDGIVSCVLTMISFAPHAMVFYVYLAVSATYRENVRTVLFSCLPIINRVTPLNEEPLQRMTKTGTN
ncbi:unnamed protein product [Adineta steineri]|uniref:G-protein coupled receptors family 1 profile domain-containing protein n=1 Tax=Adineta steineri TaxID=433720 RepID=A0A813WZ27_9BILA|nr:unnamed protein product [Adineta steineri]